MKTYFLLFAFFLIIPFSNAQVDSLDVSKVKLKTEIDSISYQIGIAISASFPIEMFPKLNVNAIAKGFAEGRDTTLETINPTIANNVVRAYMGEKYEKQQKIEQAKREAEAAKMAEVNKAKYAENYKEQQDFIAVTTAKEGVITTKTGLMYEVITEGTGTSPTPNDRVKVHYIGTYINGEEFDSSFKRNTPAVFGLNQVIAGWTEGLALMKVGSKYKFYIPSDLAYGDAGGRMEPYKLLIFEVELLAINPK